MFESKLLDEETMAKALALSLQTMVEQIKQHGSEKFLQPVRALTSMLTPQTAPHFVAQMEDNLWIPNSEDAESKLSHSIMTSMAMIGKGPVEITQHVKNYNFEKLNSILMDELSEIDFDFDTYKVYITEMKSLIAQIKLDFSLDTLNLTEQSLDLEL